MRDLLAKGLIQFFLFSLTQITFSQVIHDSYWRKYEKYWHPLNQIKQKSRLELELKLLDPKHPLYHSLEKIGKTLNVESKVSMTAKQRCRKHHYSDCRNRYKDFIRLLRKMIQSKRFKKLDPKDPARKMVEQIVKVMYQEVDFQSFNHQLVSRAFTHNQRDKKEIQKKRKLKNAAKADFLDFYGSRALSLFPIFSKYFDPQMRGSVPSRKFVLKHKGSQKETQVIRHSSPSVSSEISPEYSLYTKIMPPQSILYVSYQSPSVKTELERTLGILKLTKKRESTDMVFVDVNSNFYFQKGKLLETYGCKEKSKSSLQLEKSQMDSSFFFCLLKEKYNPLETSQHFKKNQSSIRFPSTWSKEKKVQEYEKIVRILTALQKVFGEKLSREERKAIINLANNIYLNLLSSQYQVTNRTCKTAIDRGAEAAAEAALLVMLERKCISSPSEIYFSPLEYRYFETLLHSDAIHTKKRPMLGKRINVFQNTLDVIKENPALCAIFKEKDLFPYSDVEFSFDQEGQKLEDPELPPYPDDDYVTCPLPTTAA